MTEIWTPTSPPPAGGFAVDQEYISANKMANFTCAIHGESKTGKSFCALCVDGPRFIVYLDPNRNLASNLARAHQYGFTGPDFVWEFDPLEYALLTDDEAKRRLGKIEAAARWARNQGRGTFILDGGTIFKGYMEKAFVGESPTLGFRPTKGENTGIDRKQYGISNNALRDFIQAFIGSGVDFIITFEGRARYNKAGDRLEGMQRSTMPETCRYALTLNLATLMTVEDVVEKGVVTGKKYVRRIYIGENGYDDENNDPLAGRTITSNVYSRGRGKPRGIPGIKRLFLGNIPDLADLDPENKTLRVVGAEDAIEDDDAPAETPNNS